MEIQSMLPGYLDVVFHNRNKAYGGYELRTHYPSRARNGALAACLTAGLVCSLLVVTSKDPAIKQHYPGIISCSFDVVLPPPPPLPPVQPKILEPHQGGGASGQPIHTDKLITPIVVKTSNPEDIMPPVSEMKAQAGPTASSGSEFPLAGGPSGSGDGNKIGSGPVTGGNDNTPAIAVDIMPEFIGDINSYLNANMRYPDEARASGVQGRVIIRFVVNEDGSISGAKVERGIGGGCDQEALRVVKSMPKWKPGKQNGRAVKVYFMLPVMFVLQ